MSDEPRSTRALSSVVRALALLDLVGSSNQPVRVAELARTAGASRARIHQQLVTLVEAGWMEQLPSGAYQLTLRALFLGQAALRQSSLGERLVPAMEDLSRGTHEAVSLAMLDGDAVTIVQRVEADHPVRASYRIGTRMPVHDTASGRVIVASSPAYVVARLQELGVDLPADEELEQIRAAGYAVATDWDDGIHAIAAPVAGVDNAQVIALSIAGPVSRFDPEGVVDTLKRCAEHMRMIIAGQAGQQAP